MKSLILDIDGVIVRDKKLLSHVKHNCVRYVEKKLPACKDPEKANRILYTTTGHTARGLSQNFGIDVSDFNKEVYNTQLKTHLWEVLSSTDFQKDAKDLHDLVRQGWRVTLFSNAPIEWTGEVAHAISDELFIVCPGSNILESPLKPQASAYANFQKHHTHVFVDDQMKNLETARYLPNWHPVLFSTTKTKRSKWCPTIGSIWELSLIINSVDQWVQEA